MLANGGYSDTDTHPAGAAMFHCETAMKHGKTESSNDILMSGMLTMVNILCQKLAPQLSSDQATIAPTPIPSATFSPMELCGTYFKQLVELRNLFERTHRNADTH